MDEETLLLETETAMEEAVERERENVDKSASCLESLVSDKMQYATKYDQLKACEGTCPTCGGAMTEELAGDMI